LYHRNYGYLVRVRVGLGLGKVRHRVRIRVPFRPITVHSAVPFSKLSYSCKIRNETQSFHSAVPFRKLYQSRAAGFAWHINCSVSTPARVGITAEENDCVSFPILQEYDILRNRTVGHTVNGRNGTLCLTLILTLTLCLTLTLTLKITAIYVVQLPNVFRKLIITFRRVPWTILF